MSEFIGVRKDEWEELRRDVENFVKNYNDALEQIKKLVKENSSLRLELDAATQRLATADKRASAELQQTSQTIQKLRTEISRALQQSKKET